jgi:hypothetical protein
MTLYQHLLDRGYDPTVSRAVVDEANNTATFYLYSPTGKLTGYQQYRPDRPKTREGKGMKPSELRYFTHVVPGELAFYGSESLDFDLRRVYLCEGVFDAVKLHALGLPCLAVLGNNPKPLRAFLNALGRHVVGVLDNDDAGRALSKFCDEVFVCQKHDPGDMTLDELKEFLKL